MSRFRRWPSAGAPASSRFFEQMDARLAQSEFVAGARYSIADITALVAVDFARWVKLPVPEDMQAFAPMARAGFGASERQSVKASGRSR